MKRTLHILLLCAVLPVLGYSQTTTPYDGTIAVTFPDYTMEGDSVTFRADVDFTDLGLSTRQMVEFTPILRSTNTSYEKRFSPVVVTGRQRGRVIARAERFGDYTRAVEPSQVIVLKRKTPRTAEIAVTVPFEKWMRHSELVLVETCTACCNLLQEYGAGITSKTYAGQEPYVFPAPYQPHFMVSYITPEVEPVKTRSDSYTARLNFQSGKSTLLRNFADNAAVLADADRELTKLMNDPLLSISGISVRGYASPEGYVGNNQKLSDDRARVFVDYLSTTHNLRRGNVKIKSEGMGEDWVGLRKAVADASDLEGQQAVLDAIDNIGDLAKRKTMIKNINGGRTYRTLLSEFYPSLRRNEYTIEYSVRSFNDEEAMRIYKERPSFLSLNELYMVALQYDSASPEFKEVFDFAARMYPDSPVAQFNTGAMEVENGSYDSAIRRLSKIDTPEAWNDLAVAYWHKGEYAKAQELFERAAAAGNKDAVANLEQYKRWDEDKD